MRLKRVKKQDNSILFTILSLGVLLAIIVKPTYKIATNMVRGVRNKNPFNLRKTSAKWIGLIGEDDKGFCIFDTMENGVRAGSINLRNGYFKKGLSIKEIVARYAPAEDNNNEEAYVKAIVNAHVDFYPDFVPRLLEHKLIIAHSIIKVECGYNPGVTDEMIINYLN